jgi:hypothetical protein
LGTGKSLRPHNKHSSIPVIDSRPRLFWRLQKVPFLAGNSKTMPSTTTGPNLDSSILIVGGGTWGCSTALHLARRGYKNITVLDAYDIPSPISAGNDINKIVEQGTLSLVNSKSQV